MPDKPDFTNLLQKEDPSAWLKPFMERAQARLFKFQPVTVEDRFAGFKMIHFQPHGLYVPDEPELSLKIDLRLKDIGRWTQEDDRLRAYRALQDETEQLARDGVVGKWVGQQALARSLARFRLAAWGRRGGKTRYAAAEALAIAMVRPRSTIWLAAPIARLTGRAFDYVVESLIDLGMADDCRIQNQEQAKRAVLPNGSVLEGVSCENVLSMAGAAVDFCVLDEAAQIMPDVFYRGIIPPLTDRDGNALLISSYEGEGDFFSEKVLEVKAEAEKMRAKGADFQPDWELFVGASYDMNFYAFPKGIDTDALVAARHNMPVAEFREQFGAEVAGARERVFPEFKERVHVGNYGFNPERPVHLCCDPSSGANPYAILALQDYPDKGYSVAIDELYERLKVEDYDPILRRKPWAANVVDMVIDSAWPDDMRRWNKLGWKCFPVKKPGIPESLPVVKNLLRNARLYDAFYQARVHYYMRKAGYDPEESDHLSSDDMKMILYQVEESLGDGNLTADDIKQLHDMAQFYVSRSCVHFIHELKAYHYRKRKNLNTNFQELPQDHDNHLIDGWRYYCLVPGTMVATEVGELPIELVREGHYVRTRKGWRKVTRAWQSDPDANVVRVQFSNGRELIGTADHLVLTSNEGWKPLGLLDSSDIIVGWKQSTSTTSAFDTTAIPTRKSETIASTTWARRDRCFIGSFGSQSTTDRFRQVITSIMSMATRLTMTPRIWLASSYPNIFQSMGNGVPSLDVFAINAGNNTERRNQLHRDSVPTLASQRIDGHWELITNSGRALAAGLRSRLGNISPCAIAPRVALRPLGPATPMGRSPVYDLSVEGEHEFFANGILVHNCWTFKRHAESDHPKLRSLMTYTGPQEVVEGEEEAPLDFAQQQGRLWVAEQRARHNPGRQAARSYLRRVA